MGCYRGFSHRFGFKGINDNGPGIYQVGKNQCCGQQQDCHGKNNAVAYGSMPFYLGIGAELRTGQLVFGDDVVPMPFIRIRITRHCRLVLDHQYAGMQD